MKKGYASVIALLIILLCSSFMISAFAAEETVSMNTGEIYLPLGVKVRLTFSFKARLYPSTYTIQPRKTSSWYLYTTSPATLSLFVFIPSPVNRWYSTSRELTSISSTLVIPLTTGLEARLRLKHSASLGITGPGSLSMSSVDFDYLDSSENFQVTSYSSASNGAKITVNADFQLETTISLSINLFLFEQDIATTNIGTISMTPRVSDSITISVPPNPIANLLGNPLFIIIGFVVILGTAIGIAAHRSGRKVEPIGKKTAAPSQPQPLEREKPIRPQAQKSNMIYCLYCGEKLPADASFCRKCGKKQAD